VYHDIDQFWKERVGDESSGKSNEEKEQKWYNKSVSYWSAVEATDNGVLGGFGNISSIDLTGSHAFLKLSKVVDFSGPAADCGAGIGRTTKGLLCPLFPVVDLIEPTPKFVEKAKENLKGVPTMGEFIQLGLEKWTPEPNKYSLIWCQWVLPYLTDVDLIAFLKRCVKGLRPGGVIGVKENISRDGWVADNEDFSITRTEEQYKSIFRAAGLKVAYEKLQLGFPKQLFPVKMFALVVDPELAEASASDEMAAAGATTSESKTSEDAEDILFKDVKLFDNTDKL